MLEIQLYNTPKDIFGVQHGKNMLTPEGTRLQLLPGEQIKISPPWGRQATLIRVASDCSSPSRPEGEKIRGRLKCLPLIFWYTGRDSNPQPSEPESDALSIEPPVHIYSLLIITSFPKFVKGAFLRFPWKKCCFSKKCVL